MKKTFLTFLLAGANLVVVADQTQTKFSPPKPDTTGIMVWHDDQTMHEYDHTLGKQWWYDEYIDGFPIDVEQSGEGWETRDMSQHWDYGSGGAANSTWTIDNTVTTEEWDYDIEAPIWVTTSDPQTKHDGGWLYSSNGIAPYASATWTGETNGYNLNTPLGCEWCEVENNYDTHTFTNWVESQTNHRYTRRAHTVLELLSGGRAIPGRQILHEISGWAKHMPPPYVNGKQPPYYDIFYYQYTGFHSLPCVSNNLVHLLANTLHDDPNHPAYPDQPVKGTLYYVTAAGAKPIMFTPTVFGDHFSIYGVNDTSYGANDSPSFRDAPHVGHITANSIDLTNTPTFCVGQYLTFGVAWNTTPPYVEAVSHWTLPGTFVNEQYQYSASCTSYRKNADLLTRIYSRDGTFTTYCWYVRDFVAQRASVGMNLSFLNGQTVFITSAGKFSIYRPTLTIFTNASPRSFLWLNGNLLTYGDPVTGAGSMVWKDRINSIYDDRMGISQIFRANYWVMPSLAPDPVDTLDFPAADAGEFYNVGDTGTAADGTYSYYSIFSNSPALQTIQLDDVPNLTFPTLAVWGAINFADSADYIRFKPGLAAC